MLKIYHVSGTRSIRVIWLCEELKLPYEVEVISFSPEFRSSPAWRKINPVGKVPGMADGEFSMFESGAMVQYILDRYGNGKFQPPAGTIEHALYLQWSWFAEATFARPIGEIVNHRRVFPENEQSSQVIDEMKARARLALSAVEDAITGKEFILGSSFSAADIMLGYSLMLCEKFAPPEENSEANDYWKRLQKREACQVAINA